MLTVAQHGSLSRVNGPGRADLAEAVAGHRSHRRWSQKAMALRGSISPGTIKNVEGKRSDLLPTTLIGIDTAFSWPHGTAEAILVERAPVPAVPSRQPVAAGGVSRRLLAEIEGRDILDVRSFELKGPGNARIVMTLVGDDDEDLATIRDQLLQLDNLERKFHGEE